MLQLENKSLFHCDLRAENIFVTKSGNQYNVKVNFFGLSEKVYSPDQINNEAFPIKWTDVLVLNGM